jgi:hypothetical protein
MYRLFVIPAAGTWAKKILLKVSAQLALRKSYISTALLAHAFIQA